MAPPRKAVELFLSLGVTTALAGGGLSLVPEALAQHQHLPVAAHDEGGEGGEGGESGVGAISSEVDLLVVLAQMQGHLRIAQELLEQGNPKAAEPHTGHPVDELYGAVAPALQRLGIDPFLESLEALRQQVRLNPNPAAIKPKLIAAQQAIAKASEALPAKVRQDPQITLAVVRQLAAAAATEYDGAEADGRIVEVIEYQDARGFLLEAKQFLSKAQAAMPTATQQLQAKMPIINAMLKAFPAAIAPGKAVLSSAQLQQLQSQL
ncbi:MAG: hypothetical protein ACO24U_02050 [Prochlorococcaceae cyanobacterium]|jgi:hypothetical protein